MLITCRNELPATSSRIGQRRNSSVQRTSRTSNRTRPAILMQDDYTLDADCGCVSVCSVVSRLGRLGDERLDLRCRARAGGARDLTAARKDGERWNRSNPEALPEVREH